MLLPPYHPYSGHPQRAKRPGGSPCDNWDSVGGPPYWGWLPGCDPSIAGLGRGALDRWMVGSNLLQMKWAQELKWAEWRSKEVWRADMCSQVCCKCLTTDIEYWFHAVAPASSGLPLLCVLDPKQDSPSNRRPTPTETHCPAPAAGWQ